MPITAANTGINHIAPYQPGKPVSELERELGLTHVIKLASNENPLGCSPKASAALQQAMADIAIYPDGNGFELKQAIANKYHVAMSQITLGNGSNDILELVARTFVNPSNEVMYSQHAFAIYALVTQAVGGKGVEVAALNYGHDLTAMAKAITPQTKVIYLANPNNPTGTWFTEAQFSEFMRQVPTDVLVVLDEAYVEYFPDAFNSLPYLQQYANLLISRTFSKAYGLASLRVGFALAQPQVTDLLNRVRQPFNVGSFGLAAAAAALTDDDFVAQTRAVNSAGMQQLEAGLTELGLTWIPSQANFLCINVAQSNIKDSQLSEQLPNQLTGQQVYEQLLQKGIIVRPVGGYGLPQFIRVTIGTAEQNKLFLVALAEVLQGN